MTTWINVKTAASLAHVTPRTFREDWVPEGGAARVHHRTNGKGGRARRIEIDQEDLEAVLAALEVQRAG